MPEEKTTRFYFEIEVAGEEAAKKAAELQEKLTKTLAESVKPAKSLAEAFGELDKRIAGVNKRVSELLSKFPSEMQRIDKEVKKTLKVVEKDFESLSQDVVGGSIVPDMITKVMAEYTRMEKKSGVVTEAMAEHIKVLKEAFAEVYTIPWSESVERTFKALADKLLTGSENTVRAITSSLGKMRMAFGAGVLEKPGAIPVAPPVDVSTFAQRMKQWSKDFTDAVQEASVGTWGLRRMGFMFQQLGRGIESSGKRIVTTLKSMVDSYLEFDEVATKTGASIGLTADEIDKVSDSAVQAAKEIGFIAPERVLTGFEAWAQSSGALVDTETERNKVLAQSIQITKLAELRNADLGKTTATVSAIMNIFDKDVSELNGVLATLNFVTAKSSMTLGDFGSFMQTVGPIAKDMGMTFEEVATAQLILANANIRGNRAAIAMRSIFQSLAEPSKDFTTAMDKLTDANVEFGYSWRDSIEGAVTLPKFLNLVTQATADYTAEQYNAFVATITNQRAQVGLATMLDATRDAYSRGVDVFQEVSTSLEEAPSFWERGWQAMEESDRARAQRMRQRWDEVGRSIGKSLVEAGIEPAEKASELLENLREFLEKYPGLLTGAAGVGVGAIGIGKLLTALGTLLQIMVMYKMLAAVAPGMVGALGAVGAAGAGAGVVAYPYAKMTYEIATAGSEAARKAFEKEIKFVWLPGPSGIPLRYMQAITPGGRELLGGEPALYNLKEYERILRRIAILIGEITTPTLGIHERGLLAGPPLPALPPAGGITIEAGEFISPGAVEDFKSRMFAFVADMKEIEDTYRHDSIRLTEQARERKLSVIEAYDEREIAANVSLARQLEAIDIGAAASKERAVASHAMRLEQMLAGHHKALIRAEEDFARQMARAADDYARSEARAQEDFDAQRGKSRKQFQENEARDAERFKLKIERIEKDHIDKLRGIIRERDARGFIEEMLSYARRKKEAKEDYDIRRRDARTAQAEQESDAQANFDKARKRAKEDYDRQRALAKEQYEFARARRIQDYKDQRELARTAFIEQLRLINSATEDRKRAAYRASALALKDRDAAEEKELDSIDENLEEQLAKLKDGLEEQKGELWLHFWGIDGLRDMRDQFTIEEFQAIEDAHEDEMRFYENVVLVDTQSVWAKIFQAVRDKREEIEEEARKARAAYIEILNLGAQASTVGVPPWVELPPKQAGGYTSHGAYIMHKGEFVLTSATTRALESRVGMLSQGNILGLARAGQTRSISVLLRQENWRFSGEFSAKAKQEFRDMAYVSAYEALDDVLEEVT